MISGFDITLETLDLIRMEVRDQGTPIHFDFHSLTLGIDADDKRFRRPLPDWRRWCFMLHSIQLSEQEALGLTTERYNEEDLVNQLMPLMVNGFPALHPCDVAFVTTRPGRSLPGRGDLLRLLSQGDCS